LNIRNIETNRGTSTQKQSHSQGQQARKKVTAGNNVDCHTDTEMGSEREKLYHTATRSKGLICDQCGNRYKDVSSACIMQYLVLSDDS
jgi:hypothetical protein